MKCTCKEREICRLELSFGKEKTLKSVCAPIVHTPQNIPDVGPGANWGKGGPHFQLITIKTSKKKRTVGPCLFVGPSTSRPPLLALLSYLSLFYTTNGPAGY